jgi:hypothetical protein
MLTIAHNKKRRNNSVHKKKYYITLHSRAWHPSPHRTSSIPSSHSPIAMQTDRTPLLTPGAHLVVRERGAVGSSCVTQSELPIQQEERVAEA